MEGSIFVYATFRDEEHSAKAVRALIDAAFPTGDVSALLRGEAKPKEIALTHRTGIPRGAVLGAALGALGGGALVATGGVLVVGPAFVGLLSGALAGGTFGTLVGTLAGLAHWNDAVEFPRSAFERGSVLIGVTAPEARAEEARGILLREGGRHARIATKREAEKVAREVSQHPRRAR